MKRQRRVGQVLTLSLLLATAGGLYAETHAQNATPPKPPTAQGKPLAPTKMVLEPRAMELLKAASARLAAAKSMSFTAVASYEYPSKLGPPIVYTVALRRDHATAGQAPGDDSRRRAGIRVLLRRQDDDGVMRRRRIWSRCRRAPPTIDAC